MAKKKKYYQGNKGSIFPESDSKKPVGNIPSGGTKNYGDTMEYADEQVRKNSNFKENSQ